ncbi:MAG: T9SS type A sorting domain-containing protein [Bacteroidetes bacterium]|nr:T9SS type A sorting domain-containing protein [Bacteroidota bacterium]HET6245602.1 T9SS type A sorting domain-containing protein [Bacteroidia bacterium]
MKKTYLLLVFGIISISTYAQRVTNYHLFTKNLLPELAELEEKPVKLTETINASRAMFDTIYYDDFRNGLAGTNGAWTANAVAAFCNWKHTTLPPRGQYSTTIGTLNSTSKDNGYMILDGDSANTPQSWFGSGQLPGSMGTNSNVVNAYLESPIINFSDYPGVILTFQHAFRYCCSNANIVLELEVSNDGGSTWTTFNLRDQINANTPTTNALTKSINISAVAGNQANVKLRFHKTGASHYYWMIDDVLLTEAPENDMVLERPYIDLAGRSGYYHQTPIGNVSPASFYGAVFNNGNAVQNDVKLNVEISDSTGGIEYNKTNIGKILNTLQRDTLEIISPDTFTPLKTGAYTAVFNTLQTEIDEVPSNNVRTLNFAISDTVFARDNGLGNSQVGPSSYVGGNVDAAMIGVLYEITSLAELTSMSVFIHANTANETAIIGRVFSYDHIADTVKNQLMETEIYDVLDTTSKGKWVSLEFKDKNGIVDMIDSGKTVLVAIQVYGIDVATSKYVFTRNDITTYHNGWLVSRTFFANSWGWNSSTPWIRLNVAFSDVGINETSKTDSGIKLFQNQPNPAQDHTAISYVIKDFANVKLKVYNMTGREVLNVNDGPKSPGSHTINLNTASLSGGVYYYTLTAGDKNTTKKMIVIK